MNLEQLKDRTRERAQSLPDPVWDCERCENEDCMQIRRSSLNEQFYADDIGLKCDPCEYFATHGVSFDNPDRFEEELRERDGRTIDFARDGHDPASQLEALGYTAKAKRVHD